MSRSKKQRKRENQSAEKGSALKHDFSLVEHNLKELGDFWIKIQNYPLQKEFLEKKQRTYDAFKALEKKVFLALEN